MELYSTFKKGEKVPQAKEAGKEVDQMQMIEMIVKKYPTMKEKIINYTTAEIKSFYEKIKAVDSMGPAIESDPKKSLKSMKTSKFDH